FAGRPSMISAIPPAIGSASAWARSSWLPTSCAWRGSRSVATRCVIWWAAASSASVAPAAPAKPTSATRCGAAAPPSTKSTWNGPGFPCSWSASPTCTFAFVPWASGATCGLFERIWFIMDFETHEHDVIVIGAGGAGLRAAIEASAAGVSVGLICKSLLGKAHTVMAEGGIAAALANVDDRDNWKVHFADTMRGGQYVNNWRMAELHAKEAPDRVRELEKWGAVFDRTKDGRILQRNFGGHKYPRLAHVGDRTGLEMIRTLQDHGIHQGIHVYMEVTVLGLLKDGDRIAGAVAYYRERGRFVVFRAKAVVLATGGIGKAYKITSNSWEYTGDGHALAYFAG